jgi:CRISPR-associated protein Csd1
MILQRLCELADREGLRANPAFEDQPVPYLIKLATEGAYLGLEERRGEITIESRKKGGEPKKVADRGKVLSVPMAHGAPNQAGFARYFVDTLARVLPISEEEKSVRSRKTFWQQVDRAAEATADPALRAAQTFGRRLAEYASAIQKDAAEVAPGDRCTFAWAPDGGTTIVERAKVREWYATFFSATAADKQEGGRTGICQVTARSGPLPETHPIKLTGIPGGLPVGVSLVSYDKAAFESYGLEGTVNAGIGVEAADAYPRAINALVGNKLRDRARTSLKVGGTVFLFWTKQPADTSAVMLLDDPKPDDVQHLLRSPHAGKESRTVEDENAFYLLALSGNSARAIVRDYLETPLPRIRDNLAHWFRDLTIADTRRDGAGKPTNLFPLWQLIQATAGPSDASPDVPARLLRAALLHEPLPDSVLAACVGRLRADGSEGFRPARLALVKLTLIRWRIPVSETLDENDCNRAYVCGRLLAVFEQIQYAALGDVNATVTDKYFGTFSAAPGLVLGRLYANAQNHLRKLRADKPGLYVTLDRLLSEVSEKLPTPPTGQLSLIDQAQFALGYYHQKAKRFEEIAERKAAKAAKTAAAE